MTPARESLASPRLWLAFVTMLLVSGIANTFPVFFPSLLAEFGGSRGGTAAAASLLWVGGAILGPVAGYLISNSNPRMVVTLGLAASASGLGLATVSPSLTFFVAAVGIGGGIGIGLTRIPAQAALLADRYVRRRGLAMGIAFSGSMAGYALSPVVQWVITRAGWRGALACYALGVLALIPCALRVHPSRLDSSRRSATVAGRDQRAVASVVGSLPFWSLLVVFTVPPLVGYLATTQHALYFSARGFSAHEPSVLLAVGGVLAASGRALAGLLADRLGAPAAGFVSFGCSLMGMGCLLAMEAWPGWLFACGYVLFLFLPMGSRATIVSVLVSRIAPPTQYGTVFGLLGIGNNLGAAAGPWLSGWLYDVTASYLVIYLWATGFLLAGLAALTVFCMTSRPAGA